MALMFSRLARNFVKNGYYPTDTETTMRALRFLAPAPDHAAMRILDPCCGEGVALAECKHALVPERTVAFGIEYDGERAWHAKTLLDRCIHGDLFDCIVGQRQFGLLWHNPPYGDLVADRAVTSDEVRGGRPRLEKKFYRETVSLLQHGGVLVLIVPHYALDQEFRGLISRHFKEVRAYMAPEQQFQQAVIFGIRANVGVSEWADTRALLARVQEGQGDVLPEQPEATYTVPLAPAEGRFELKSLDEAQLRRDLETHPGLWPQFQTWFSKGLTTKAGRPLASMSSWHLALALAAGQVSGVVESEDGRRFAVRGGTHKEKVVRNETENDAKGEVVAHVRVATDRFVPVIRAIDLTPGDTLGQIARIV